MPIHCILHLPSCISFIRSALTVQPAWLKQHHLPCSSSFNWQVMAATPELSEASSAPLWQISLTRCISSPAQLWQLCSETALSGDTWFHCEFVHPRKANCWPPRQEANGLPTGPVRLCVGVKLQCLHRSLPKLLDWGSKWALCYEEEEEDLQGVEWNQGRQCVITAGFSHIVSVKPSEASHCRHRA